VQYPQARHFFDSASDKHARHVSLQLQLQSVHAHALQTGTGTGTGMTPLRCGSGKQRTPLVPFESPVDVDG
jgi:hypothetical protein